MLVLYCYFIGTYSIAVHAFPKYTIQYIDKNTSFSVSILWSKPIFVTNKKFEISPMSISSYSICTGTKDNALSSITTTACDCNKLWRHINKFTKTGWEVITALFIFHCNSTNKQHIWVFKFNKSFTMSVAVWRVGAPVYCLCICLYMSSGRADKSWNWAYEVAVIQQSWLLSNGTINIIFEIIFCPNMSCL